MTARDDLWEVAVDQYGFITARDALDLGVSRAAIDGLLARGQLQRCGHGVYRLPKVPVSEYDPYMLAVLWVGGRHAYLSHDTALAVWELCDINPDRIHVTVPRAHRVRRTGGEPYVVHREDLRPERVTWWRQIPTATPTTAIEQGIRSGVPTYLLRQALERGEGAGHVSQPERARLQAALEQRHA